MTAQQPPPQGQPGPAQPQQGGQGGQRMPPGQPGNGQQPEGGGSGPARGKAGSWEYLVCWKHGQIDLKATRANFPCNDQDTAILLAAEQPRWLHYADGSGTWHRWNDRGKDGPGTHHQPLTPGLMRLEAVAYYAARAEFALQQCRQRLALEVASSNPGKSDDEIKQAIEARWADEWKPMTGYAAKVKNDGGQKALLGQLAAIRAVPDDHMADRFPYLLNNQANIADLRTGAWWPHDPAALMTYCVPAAYRPGPQPASPPLFTKLLNSVCGGREEVARYVIKALGYSLIGANPDILVFFINGPTKSGKTALLSVICELLEAISHESQTSLITVSRNGRHARAEFSLRGKRFVTITETSEFIHIDEAQLKRLTGERRISMDELYGKTEARSRVSWTIWVATNKMPSILDFDAAIQERVIVIPGGPTIPEHERDKELVDKILATERDQVLTMLIEGCVAWHRKGGTARPAAVEAETARYRSQQNTVANFVTECCLTVPAGASGWVEMTDSLAWYRVWVAQRKSGPPLGVTTFYEHMEALGGVAREDNGGSVRRFHGIVWNREALDRLEREASYGGPQNPWTGSQPPQA